MLPSLEQFSLIVKEGLAPLVNCHRLLGGGMPLFPTSNYSVSLLEPVPEVVLTSSLPKVGIVGLILRPLLVILI
jgi:hypothetical protein